MGVKLIGVPLKQGCSIPGADMGIGELDLVFDSVIPCPDIEGEERADAKHLSSVLSACKALSEETKDSYSLVIGGDHSLSMGSLRASAAQGIIWIDSHGDINTSESSLSKNIHGMPLSAAMGYGLKELTDLFSFHRKPEHVALFGVRDLDPAEEQFIKEWGIHVWSMEEIKKRGFAECFEELVALFIDIPFHLSFDLDCLDADAFPYVNLAAPGAGFSMNQGKEMIRRLTGMENNTGCDIVEYNPLRDQNGTGKVYVARLCEIVKQNRMLLAL